MFCLFIIHWGWSKSRLPSPPPHTSPPSLSLKKNASFENAVSVCDRKHATYHIYQQHRGKKKNTPYSSEHYNNHTYTSQSRHCCAAHVVQRRRYALKPSVRCTRLEGWGRRNWPANKTKQKNKKLKRTKTTVKHVHIFNFLESHATLWSCTNWSTVRRCWSLSRVARANVYLRSVLVLVQMEAKQRRNRIWMMQESCARLKIYTVQSTVLVRVADAEMRYD